MCEFFFWGGEGNFVVIWYRHDYAAVNLCPELSIEGDC